MSKESERFGVGVMHKLAIALAKQGYAPNELNALCEDPEAMMRMIDVHRGYALPTSRRWIFKGTYCAPDKRLSDWDEKYEGELVRFKFIEDGNFAPNSQLGRQIFKRRADGLYLNGKRLELCEATAAQVEGRELERKKWYDYAEVYKELRAISSANLALAYFLLHYRMLIPEEWYGDEYGRHLFFPATIVSNMKGEVYPHGWGVVPCLYLRKSRTGELDASLVLKKIGGCCGEGLSRPSAIIA